MRDHADFGHSLMVLERETTTPGRPIRGGRGRCRELLQIQILQHLESRLRAVPVAVRASVPRRWTSLHPPQGPCKTKRLSLRVPAPASVRQARAFARAGAAAGNFKPPFNRDPCSPQEIRSYPRRITPGRISVVKRRHGLDRSRYKGDAGMLRWVGLGVIADNLINISRVMVKQSAQ